MAGRSRGLDGFLRNHIVALGNFDIHDFPNGNQVGHRSTRADADEVAANDTADGDSRLSQAEFVGQRVQRLTAIDADRDGHLDLWVAENGGDVPGAQSRLYRGDGTGSFTDITFTVARKDLRKALEVLNAVRSKVGFDELAHSADVVDVYRDPVVGSQVLFRIHMSDTDVWVTGITSV